MSDVKLLPCPFCGGPSERIDFGPGDAENAGGSCIACTRCQASGPVEFGRKENFISNWNRRACIEADRGARESGGEAVGTVLGGIFHYLCAGHRLPDNTMLYTHPAPDDVARQRNIFALFEGSTDSAYLMLIKTRLAMRVTEEVRSRGWTWAQAAKELGITQPRMSDLKRGKLDRFSADHLLRLAYRLGVAPEAPLPFTATKDHTDGA